MENEEIGRNVKLLDFCLCGAGFFLRWGYFKEDADQIGTFDAVCIRCGAAYVAEPVKFNITKD